MKMTPATIAEMKRRKEAQEKRRPGRQRTPGVASEKNFQKPNTQLNPENFKTGPQKPTETPRLKRPKMGPKPKERQLDPKIQQRKRPKMMGGGRIGFKDGTPRKRFKNVQEMKDKFRSEKFRSAKNKGVDPKTTKAYQGLRGGGVAEAAAKLRRQGLKGGGLCVKGMNREAIGKNS